MLSTRNQLLATLALAVPFAAPVAVADDGPVTVDDHFEVDGTCEPPISTCGGPVILSAEEAVRPEIWPPPPECPPGYACTCVSSCPGCDDCAAQVCVRAEAECKTACDCAGGLGCFDGQCIAGFAPVFCCDEGECPAGSQCQFRDGRFDLCRDDCPDDAEHCGGPTCQERVDKVMRKIARKVGRSNHCESAHECVRIDTSTRCRGTCGAWINEERTERLAGKIDRLDERLCASYREDGCPYAAPICLMEKPACVEGRCVGLGVVEPPWPLPLFRTD